MAYENNWLTDGLYRTFTGDIAASDILDANLRLHKDPRFSRMAFIINDFTSVTSIKLETEHTEVYATTDELVSITKGKLKIALLVKGEQQRALAEHYRELMRDKRFSAEVFEDKNEATNWASGV